MIEGARLVPLAKVVNARGHLLEVQRHDDPHFPGFGQAYVTATRPGIVKAWYRHTRQFDQIALVQGAATVVLFDARPGSPTRDGLIEWRIDDDSPGLVQIPPGVWHGFQASAPLLLLHLNTVAHDPVHTDEDRLPADTPEIPYRWR